MKGLRGTVPFSVDAKLVLLLIATYSLNIDLGASLRPVDLVIALLFLYTLVTGKLRVDTMAVVSLLLLLAVLSAGWGALLDPSDLAVRFGLGLLLKYAELLFLIWSISSLSLTSNEINQLLKISAAVFLVIMAYVFLRAPLAAVGLMRIQHLRPDFPFTRLEPGQSPAGHLMGMYLTTGFVMLISHRVISKASSLVTVLIILLGISSILLTGSRTPFIALAGTTVVAVAFLPRQFGRVRQQTLRLFLFGAAIGAVSVIAFLGSEILDSDQVGALFQRATSFDFANDASASGRVAKSRTGLLNVWSSGILIGPGSLRFGAWFDNGLVRVLHDFGLVGLIVALILVGRISIHALDTETVYGKIAFLGITCFAIGNVATEFFLVPRASVPFIVATFLLIRRAKTASRSEPTLPPNDNGPCDAPYTT